MKVFNFTLAFSVMAADELDARVKLKELLKSISKEAGRSGCVSGL